MHIHTHSMSFKELNAYHQNVVLPLLPAKIISSSKHKEKTLNRKENDCIAGQHKATGSPFDLEHKKRGLNLYLLHIVFFENLLFSALETSNEILHKTAKRLNVQAGDSEITR